MRPALLSLSVLTLSAGAISDSERQRALDHLDASRARLVATVESMTPQQWTFKPAPDRWSPAECVEHITITEQRILGGIRQALNAPPDPAKFDRTRDEVIVARMPDRSRKAQAPEEIVPTGRPEFASVQSAITAFDAVRAETVTFTKETRADLRAHGFKHMAFGDLDGYQWLLLLSAHCQRHTLQIEEVKASTGWPK
jgi:hypothetical protein